MFHIPLSDQLANEAHRSGKEIILHIPMEAQHHHRLGPGGFKVEMTKQEFINTLRKNLNSIPLAIGMNNHMGSLLTTHPMQMHWLMDELKNQGYAYVDSMTTNQSVANVIARNKKVPYLIRDVFLDHEVSHQYIQQQLQELINKAQDKGYAIAIGHPHPQTLDAVEKFIAESHLHNIKIVSLKDMLKHRKHTTSTLRTTSLPEQPQALKIN